MELLVCVINNDEKLEEVLTGFLEMGVTGATVLKSEGMGRVLTQDVPVMTGLQQLMRSRPQNTTVFSVIESPARLERAIAFVQDVVGDLTEPSTGILFTVPLSRVEGLSPKLDPASG